MELLEQISDPQLREEISLYVQNLHSQIALLKKQLTDTMKVEAEKKEKKRQRRLSEFTTSPNRGIKSFSPDLQRRLSSESYKSNTGWVGKAS